MTLNKAFEDFVNSTEYKGIAKLRDSRGGKFRAYLSRYRAGTLKAGAITELLIKNGYVINANKVTKINTFPK